VQTLATYQPKRVVDLGCGTGLWLDLLNDVLPTGCEFIGLDSDVESLATARKRATHWGRASRFEHCDIESSSDTIPASDLTLAFNVFSYLEEPAALLTHLRDCSRVVAVRQYDGAALRFGPMNANDRAVIENSLRASVLTSKQFRHYDMDRAFECLRAAPFSDRKLGFELFARTAPFPEDFLEYYEGTMAWTVALLSENAARLLRSWHKAGTGPENNGGYFYEVDLVGVLS
jgi:SAM-dependent methyltransferase